MHQPNRCGWVPSAVVTSAVIEQSLAKDHGRHYLPALNSHELRLDQAKALSHENWRRRLRAPTRRRKNLLKRYRRSNQVQVRHSRLNEATGAKNGGSADQLAARTNSPMQNQRKQRKLRPRRAGFTETLAEEFLITIQLGIQTLKDVRRGANQGI